MDLKMWRQWLVRMTGCHPEGIMEFPDMYFDQMLKDAEAELEKARREGHMQGMKDSDLPSEAQIRADERGRIARSLDELHANFLRQWQRRSFIRRCITRIKSRPAQDPKPLEKLTGLSFGDFRSMCEHINDLVDAVNELRARK